MNVSHSFVIEFDAEGLHRAKEFESAIRAAIKEHGGHVTHIDHGEEDEYQKRQRNKEEIHDFLEAMRDHFENGEPW